MGWQAKPISVSQQQNRVILTVDYQNTDDPTQNFTQKMEVQNMVNEAELLATIRNQIASVIKAKTYYAYLEQQIAAQIVITETGVALK